MKRDDERMIDSCYPDSAESEREICKRIAKFRRGQFKYRIYETKKEK